MGVLVFFAVLAVITASGLGAPEKQDISAFRSNCFRKCTQQMEVLDGDEAIQQAFEDFLSSFNQHMDGSSQQSGLSASVIEGFIQDFNKTFQNAIAISKSTNLTTEPPMKIIKEGAPPDPCNPGPCPINANCTYNNNRVDCSCFPGYYGNPYVECRPECTINSDCPKILECVNIKCRDPCPGACGINAICDAVNHNAECSCPRGYTGDPKQECRRGPSSTPASPIAVLPPVRPTAEESLPPISGQPPIHQDSPIISEKTPQPGLQPPIAELPLPQTPPPTTQRPTSTPLLPPVPIACENNDHCTTDNNCINKLCLDACSPGVCGENHYAECRTHNHRPVCLCPPGTTGDPQIACKTLLTAEITTPVSPIADIT